MSDDDISISPNSGDGTTWTTEKPTGRLRFRGGMLEQQWGTLEMRGWTVVARHEEWRLVPKAEDEG